MFDCSADALMAVETSVKQVGSVNADFFNIRSTWCGQSGRSRLTHSNAEFLRRFFRTDRDAHSTRETPCMPHASFCTPANSGSADGGEGGRIFGDIGPESC